MLIKPNSVRQSSLSRFWPAGGLLFAEKTRSLIGGPHLGNFRSVWMGKRRRISPEFGSTNFQPVMFDMDPFGGKKFPVPSTKAQIEADLAAARWALCRSSARFWSSIFLALSRCWLIWHHSVFQGGVGLCVQTQPPWHYTRYFKNEGYACKL